LPLKVLLLLVHSIFIHMMNDETNAK